MNAALTPQSQELLAHMQAGHSLTRRSADIDFGVGSLTKRISEIRGEGYNIIGEWETNNKTGKRFMRYRMAANDNAPVKTFDKYVEVDFDEIQKGDELMLLRIQGRDIHACLRDGECGVFWPAVVGNARDQHGRILCSVENVSNGFIQLSFGGTSQVVHMIHARGNYVFARLEKADA